MSFLNKLKISAKQIVDTALDNHEGAKFVRDWCLYQKRAVRNQIPRLTGEHRKRALDSLAKVTKVKTNEDGSKSFLLYRGGGSADRSSKIMSYTPNIEVAKYFAQQPTLVGKTGQVEEHWVNENDIHGSAMHYFSSDSKFDSQYKREHEIFVVRKLDTKSEVKDQ